MSMPSEKARRPYPRRRPDPLPEELTILVIVLSVAASFGAPSAGEDLRARPFRPCRGRARIRAARRILVDRSS
jgi:hypothetical protein